MSPEAHVEIQVLSSIYSAAQESLSLSLPNFLQVKLGPLLISFQIPQDYPHERAPILLGLQGGGSSNKEGLALVERHFSPGNPSLYAIIEALKDHFASSEASSSTPPSRSAVNEEEKTFTMIELDHIRDEKRYVKTLRQLIGELGLSGRLLLLGSRILLLLLGGGEALHKDLLTQLRSRKPDVDAKGKPCKERLARVLISLNGKESKFISDSNIWQGSSSSLEVLKESSSIQDFLSQYNLIQLYDQYLI